jgi:hypothetical protein
MGIASNLVDSFVAKTAEEQKPTLIDVTGMRIWVSKKLAAEAVARGIAKIIDRPKRLL